MMNKTIPITKKVIETQQQARDSVLNIFLWTADSYKRSKITKIIRNGLTNQPTEILIIVNLRYVASSI